ncbi:MAG: RnfABCDGE type electron transport complex subunit D [Clostridia bacterium]|nr:RnfABCDGE type electron transport complex subunit D [Clostridia bacterium]
MNAPDSKPHLLTVSPSPHMHSPRTTSIVMLDVIIALVPLLIWACYVFGMRALTVTVITVGSCVLFELLYCLIMKKPITVYDLSAVVTGLLLAYNLPVTIPLWMPVLGAFFSVVIVKMLFGGIGKNIVNPALAGRAFLMASFASAMTVKTLSARLGLFGSVTDEMILSGATPLKAVLQNTGETTFDFETVKSAFIGYESGVIGEVSGLLIVLGLVYLLIRKVITWHIPVAYIGTVALFAYLLPPSGFARFDIYYTLTQVCSGGLLLGAVFMATDYVTCPITKKGRLIFGVGCGLLTVLIRYFAGNEGVSYAILTMNLLTFYIDKITVPRPYGIIKEKKKASKEAAK